MVKIVEAAVALAIGSVVFGKLREQLVEGVFVEKPLFDKITAQLLLLAALMEQQGTHLNGTQQSQLFGPFPKLEGTTTVVEDLFDLFLTQPAPTLGNNSQVRPLPPLPGNCGDQRAEGDYAEIIDKQAELQRSGWQRSAVILAIGAIMTAVLRLGIA